jgi:hypothetical protein
MHAFIRRKLGLEVAYSCLKSYNRIFINSGSCNFSAKCFLVPQYAFLIASGVGNILSFKPKPFSTTYSFSIAKVEDFNLKHLGLPPLAEAVVMFLFFKSISLNVRR